MSALVVILAVVDVLGTASTDSRIVSGLGGFGLIALFALHERYVARQPLERLIRPAKQGGSGMASKVLLLILAVASAAAIMIYGTTVRPPQ